MRSGAVLACEVLREVHASLNGRPILAASISGTMGGAWLVDRAGQPVRRGILWNDGRAAGYLRDWSADGTLARLFDLSCNACAPGFTLPVLRWLKDHEPDVLASAHRLLFAKDYLRFCLTGELATEESDASHVPGDVHERGFSVSAMRLCGVEDAVRLLPEVIASGAVAGTVTPVAMRATGLPAGTPVVTGLADVSATLLGAGGIRPGVCIAIAGTSLLNCATTREPVFEPRGVGVSFLLPGRLHARAMPNQTGALAVNWFAREFLTSADDGAPDPSALDALAMQVPPGSRGVLFHPYLNSTGVIAPVYEPRARGRFWGLGIEHTRADLLRAVYEGVAFSMADCLRALVGADGCVRLVGGLSNSPFWRQLFADVTGRRVVSMTCPEAGALGVAMLAGVALSVWRDLEHAVDTGCRVGPSVEPEPDRHAFYAQRYKLYRHLRERLTEECNLSEETQ